MSVKYVCDYCNKFEFESEDGELVQQKMLEHYKTHTCPNCGYNNINNIDNTGTFAKLNEIDDRDFITKVREFHTKFNVPRRFKPGFTEKDIMQLRIKLLKEEVLEFEEAYSKGDLVEAFDALIDLMYVLCGTIDTMGLDGIFEEGFDIVHHCNMQKVRAIVESDSKRKSTFDVVKPEGWQSPVLSHLVFDKCEKCGSHHNAEECCE